MLRKAVRAARDLLLAAPPRERSLGEVGLWAVAGLCFCCLLAGAEASQQGGPRGARRAGGGWVRGGARI